MHVTNQVYIFINIIILTIQNVDVKFNYNYLVFA